jgi:hypothetical protein
VTNSNGKFRCCRINDGETHATDGQEEPKNKGRTTEMIYQLPKSLNKNELKKSITAWEKRMFKEPTNTLSKCLDDKRFIEAWDTAELSSAEVSLIHEKYVKGQSDCLILIHLKKQ